MEPKSKENPSQDDARQRLIDSALALFVERGYAATSVREIVSAAGVTKPVLYYYFSSKEGLFLHIMGMLEGLMHTLIGEIGTVGGTARQRIIHLLTCSFAAATDNFSVVRFAYAIFFGPPQGNPFVDLNRHFDTLLELVGEMVEAGVRCGEIRECDRRALAWALMGAFNAVLEEQFARAEPRLGRDDLVQIINIIFDGVSVEKRSLA